MGGNKILEMTWEDYLDKTGVKENKQLSLSGYQQDSPCSGSSCKTFVSSGGKKKQQTSSPQTLPHPTFFTFFLEKKAWIPCSTVTKHAFLSVAQRELSTTSQACFCVQNKGADTKPGLGTPPPGPHCLLVQATGTSASFLTDLLPSSCKEHPMS